jgi:hypothetical protein
VYAVCGGTQNISEISKAAIKTILYKTKTRRKSTRRDDRSSDGDVMRKKSPEIGDQDDDDEVNVCFLE